MLNNENSVSSIIKTELNKYYMAALCVDGYVKDDYFIVFHGENMEIEDVRNKLFYKYSHLIDTKFVDRIVNIVIQPLTLYTLLARDEVCYEFMTHCKQFKGLSWEITNNLTAFKINDDTCILFKVFNTLDKCCDEELIIINMYTTVIRKGYTETILTFNELMCWAFADKLDVSIFNYEEVAKELEF